MLIGVDNAQQNGGIVVPAGAEGLVMRYQPPTLEERIHQFCQIIIRAIVDGGISGMFIGTFSACYCLPLLFAENDRLWEGIAIAIVPLAATSFIAMQLQRRISLSTIVLELVVGLVATTIFAIPQIRQNSLFSLNALQIVVQSCGITAAAGICKEMIYAFCSHSR